MDDVQILLAIEQIKRLKARYFLCLDTQDWAGWKADVFAPDAQLYVPESLAGPIVGADAIIAWTAARATGQTSVHHGHMPIIDIHTTDSASGVWAMEDILFKTPEQAERLGFRFVHGFGHYHETYVRGPQGWRIASTRLTRLYVETSLEGPPMRRAG